MRCVLVILPSASWGTLKSTLHMLLKNNDEKELAVDGGAQRDVGLYHLQNMYRTGDTHFQSRVNSIQVLSYHILTALARAGR